MTAPGRKNDVVQIRVSAEAKAMLNLSSILRGQKLSEFILDSAKKHAEEVVLDRQVSFWMTGARIPGKFLMRQ